MSLSQRWQEVRRGFEPAFWVANVSELFERLSFYGVQAVLAIYLHENLRFSETQAGDLIGFFSAVVWFLPILGGTLADRIGFRRALAAAYLVLALGYFLLGSLASPWMGPLREAIPLYWLMLVLLAIPALGPAIVKPCVVGTTARASSENVRSLGYSIYYTLVNIGGMLGPLVAYLVRRSIGIENVFRVCAASVFLMSLATILFFKEPSRSGEQKVSSFAEAFRNMFVVLRNFKFMLFLVLFSGFWILFWQEFISLPLFIRDVNPQADVDLLLTVDPLVVILLQIVVSFLTRKIRSFTAMVLGFLITSLAWLFLGLGDMSWQINTAWRIGGWEIAVQGIPWMAVFALMGVGLGEMVQSPRYYEYVSRLAPPGQQGTYMGYAFLPIAIGSLLAGLIGGRLVHYYREVAHLPQRLWLVITGIGLLSTLLLWIYDRVVKPPVAPAAS